MATNEESHDACWRRRKSSDIYIDCESHAKLGAQEGKLGWKGKAATAKSAAIAYAKL